MWDEASQSKLSELVIPLSLLNEKEGRVFLFGDDNQMGPIKQGYFFFLLKGLQLSHFYTLRYDGSLPKRIYIMECVRQVPVWVLSDCRYQVRHLTIVPYF